MGTALKMATLAERGPILVVEDDADVVGILDILLTSEGYEVRSAANGAEALELLRQGLEPSLIVLDLMMPVMNGWQFRTVQRQEESLRDIPVVLMSGAGEGTKGSSALEADAYLRKPVDLGELLEVIARLAGA